MASTFAPPPTHPPKLVHPMYLAPDEGVIRESRETGWKFLPGPIALLLLSAFLLYSSLAAHLGTPGVPYLTDFFSSYTVSVPYFGTIWVLLFSVLTAIAFFWLLIRIILWGRKVYAITPRRVVLQDGIFNREFDQIPIVQIRGVRVRMSFGQRILGYGTVIISAEGETPSKAGQLEWDWIPGASEWPRLIDQVTQARNQASIDQAARAAVSATERAELLSTASMAGAPGVAPVVPPPSGYRPETPPPGGPGEGV